LQKERVILTLMIDVPKNIDFEIAEDENGFIYEHKFPDSFATYEFLDTTSENQDGVVHSIHNARKTSRLSGQSGKIQFRSESDPIGSDKFTGKAVSYGESSTQKL